MNLEYYVGSQVDEFKILKSIDGDQIIPEQQPNQYAQNINNNQQPQLSDDNSTQGINNQNIPNQNDEQNQQQTFYNDHNQFAFNQPQNKYWKNQQQHSNYSASISNYNSNDTSEDLPLQKFPYCQQPDIICPNQQILAIIFYQIQVSNLLKRKLDVYSIQDICQIFNTNDKQFANEIVRKFDQVFQKIQQQQGVKYTQQDICQLLLIDYNEHIENRNAIIGGLYINYFDQNNRLTNSLQDLKNEIKNIENDKKYSQFCQDCKSNKDEILIDKCWEILQQQLTK